MIKINLLPQKKVRRAEPGQQSLLAIFLVYFVAGALVFFLLHKPLAADVDRARQDNARVQRTIKTLTEETKDFDIISRQFEEAQQQAESIRVLNEARATPAWLLRELSSLLTKGHQPTMLPSMAERVKTDPNLRWDATWDPKRVWVDTIVEKGGKFTLTGGALADSDITQFVLRVQASVHFANVIPEGGSRQSSKAGGTYRFTITGDVRY